MYRVLLVEDNIENCEMLCAFLGKAKCYQTAVAHDAEHALQLAGTQPFDLILLDIMLPGMDGIHLCEQLRKTLYCPILFVSCLDDEETILRAFRMGGDDYITKPFRYPVLCARMEAVLRRVKQSAAAPARDIKIGDMTLSVEQHAILKDGKNVNLSPIEYDILRYFAKIQIVHLDMRRFTGMSGSRRAWGISARCLPMCGISAKRLKTIRRTLNIF